MKGTIHNITYQKKKVEIKSRTDSKNRTSSPEKNKFEEQTIKYQKL